MDNYTIIRKNGILPFATTWINLEGIMLREMSDRERQIFYVITYMWNLKNKTNEYNKTETDTEDKLVLSIRRGIR